MNKKQYLHHSHPSPWRATMRRILPRTLVVCLILWIAVVWSTALSTQQHYLAQTTTTPPQNHYLFDKTNNQNDTHPQKQEQQHTTHEEEEEAMLRHNWDGIDGNAIAQLFSSPQQHSQDNPPREPFLLSSSFWNTATTPPENTRQQQPWWAPLAKEILCFPQSQWIMDTNDATRWTTRLVYLSIYKHQYGPAVNFGQSSSSKSQCHPDTKYLVTSLSDKGIGANFRLTAVSALKAALATNRVLLLVNNISSNNASTTSTHGFFLHEPWALASCPRGDVECFFRPVTPCSVPLREIAQAHVLTRPETRALFRHGQLPKNDRVVVLPAAFLARPQRNPPQLQSVLTNVSRAILEQQYPSNNNNNATNYPTAARQGLARLLQPQSTNGMFRGDYQISNALMMFALRPLPHYARDMHRIVQEVLRGSKTNAPSLGMPIRASDKCDTESQCLSAEQYLQAAREMWQDSWSHTWMTDAQKDLVSTSTPLDSIDIPLMVTSEDKGVLKDITNALQKMKGEIKTNHSNATWSFRLIQNPLDVSQGTGAIKSLNNQGGTNTASKETMMVSALSSLLLQMTARYSLVNCCSNFHKLLQDFLDEGCGWQELHTSQCLQSHPNPSLRMCCAWGENQCESFQRKKKSKK